MDIGYQDEDFQINATRMSLCEDIDTSELLTGIDACIDQLAQGVFAVLRVYAAVVLTGWNLVIGAT